ncbi:unnamed protein product [Amaranthus hypochondriacus]
MERQSSYSYDSSNKNKIQTISLLKSFSEHPYGRFDKPRLQQLRETAARSSSSSSSRSSKMQAFFRKIRRKFRKEKKAFGSGNESEVVIVPYNSFTYSKNFDDKELVLSEPDNLCRSFSARFAVSSSRMLKRVQSVR